ncbi:MAG TPA: mechanosensitive ion channel domain-containing protein [Longimicrobiales bacterium]
MRHPLQGQESIRQADQAIEAVRPGAADSGELISAPDILLALAILGATHYLIRGIASVVQALARRLPRHRIALLQLIPLIRTSLWIASVCFIVVGIISPSREALIALAATTGIAIGFAAQDVLKNVFGGIQIVIDRPFQVGDLIDVGTYHGEVVGIGLRATRIRTRDDAIVVVPNSQVVRQAVRNASAGEPHCMVTVELFLPAHIDTTRARQICHEAAATSPYVYSRKPITISFQDDFRETFLTRACIRAYVHDHRYENAFASDVAERAKRALLESGLLTAPGPASFPSAGEPRSPDLAIL